MTSHVRAGRLRLDAGVASSSTLVASSIGARVTKITFGTTCWHPASRRSLVRSCKDSTRGPW